MKESDLFDSNFLENLGVAEWGYTENPIPTSLHHFESWANQGHHGSLNYLNDHRKHLRKDLRHVFHEFQSALVFLFSYRPVKKWMIENDKHQVAAYTLGFEGQDYHHALKVKLQEIASKLPSEDLKTFLTLDTQPVLERDLAYRAGLGWFGKNSMLINQKEGSYFIIGSLLLNKKLNLEIKTPDVDHCGQCVACIDACPTKAIDPETRTLAADKCISTFTIETFKEAEAPKGFTKSRGEIFGCDICQDVCPWNRKPLERTSAALKLKEPYDFVKHWFYEMTLENLKKLIENETNRGLKKKFFGTPFDRPGRIGWLKNLRASLSKSS